MSSSAFGAEAVASTLESLVALEEALALAGASSESAFEASDFGSVVAGASDFSTFLSLESLDFSFGSTFSSFSFFSYSFSFFTS